MRYIAKNRTYVRIPFEHEWVFMMLPRKRNSNAYIVLVDECVTNEWMSICSSDLNLLFEGKTIIDRTTGYHSRGIPVDKLPWTFLGDYFAAAGFEAVQTSKEILLAHSRSINTSS